MDNVKVPQNNRYLETKKEKTQSSVESAFGDFKKLLSDKIHPDNQTPAYHNNVVAILNRLLTSADKLDESNPGEGIFGLIVLALRSILKVKDDSVKMEVEIRELKREIERLKKHPNFNEKSK
jgi:hypothetical protein